MQLSQIGVSELQEWTANILVACGLGAEDAKLAASVLVRSDLRGIGTHGVSRLIPYAAMLRTGAMNPTGRATVSGDGPVFQIDADRALGQVAGAQAVDALSRAAKRDGAALGIIRNVGHLGALGVLLLPVAENGLLGLMVQNGPPAMALPGATKAAIGNNPMGFVAPVGKGEPPLVVDIATSTTAMGKILEAARAGEAIPLGWAVDEEGKPTTDPGAALKGFLAPMGGHKGIGLAFIVEALAGALTGTRPVAGPESGFRLPPAFGAFVMIIDPDAVGSREAFDAYLAQSIDIYRGASVDARYPGEGAAALEAERLREGIPLSAALIRDLTALGEELAKPFPAPRGAP